jgi:hypothetical protein
MGGVARAASPVARGVGASGQVVLDDLAQKVAGFTKIWGFGRGGGFGARFGGGGIAHGFDFRRAYFGPTKKKRTLVRCACLLLATCAANKTGESD